VNKELFSRRQPGPPKHLPSPPRRAASALDPEALCHPALLTRASGSSVARAATGSCSPITRTPLQDSRSTSRQRSRSKLQLQAQSFDPGERGVDKGPGPSFSCRRNPSIPTSEHATEIPSVICSMRDLNCSRSRSARDDHLSAPPRLHPVQV
jgi:hypothetical protein